MSFFLAFTVSVTVTSIACSAVHLYVNFAASPKTKKKLKKIMPKVFVAYCVTSSIGFPTAGHFLAPHGPMGAYNGKWYCHGQGVVVHGHAGGNVGLLQPHQSCCWS